MPSSLGCRKLFQANGNDTGAGVVPWCEGHGWTRLGEKDRAYGIRRWGRLEAVREIIVQIQMMEILTGPDIGEEEANRESGKPTNQTWPQLSPSARSLRFGPRHSCFPRHQHFTHIAYGHTHTHTQFLRYLDSCVLNFSLLVLLPYRFYSQLRLRNSGPHTGQRLFLRFALQPPEPHQIIVGGYIFIETR